MSPIERTRWRAIALTVALFVLATALLITITRAIAVY
jgi:hypothetical protein